MFKRAFSWLKSPRSIDDEHGAIRILIAVMAIIYGFALFNHGLVPSMEPRFAEVIKEMLASGEYLVPIKNGRPYVEYPPLLYWLGLFGKSVGLSMEAAIRLPCYLALLGWIAWLARLQKVLNYSSWNACAFALIGAASPGILYQFFTAQTDGLVILGVLIAFTGFARVRLDDTKGGFPWELWLGVGLATAAKGPVGIAITLPIMFLEIVWSVALQSSWRQLLQRRGFSMLFDELRKMAWLRGGVILMLIVVPWYLVAGWTHGWVFIKAVLIYQNFDRFVYGFSHQQPWWYYFPDILAELFPVILLVPAGLVWAYKNRTRFEYRLPLIWAVLTFLFFTVSSSKQGKYILPAAPAFVMLGFIALDIGLPFVRRHAGRLWRGMRNWAVFMIAVWGVSIIAVLPFYGDNIADVQGYSVIRQQIEKAPGNIVHFGWPRSLTLYELGAPMDFVRSSRELYQRIASGDIEAGDYLLIREFDLASSPQDDIPWHLTPMASSDYLIEVLRVVAKNEMVLYRIADGAKDRPMPDTPAPPPVFWRDKMFDTD